MGIRWCWQRMFSQFFKYWQYSFSKRHSTWIQWRHSEHRIFFLIIKNNPTRTTGKILDFSVALKTTSAVHIRGKGKNLDNPSQKDCLNNFRRMILEGWEDRNTNGIDENIVRIVFRDGRLGGPEGWEGNSTSLFSLEKLWRVVLTPFPIKWMIMERSKINKATESLWGK